MTKATQELSLCHVTKYLLNEFLFSDIPVRAITEVSPGLQIVYKCFYTIFLSLKTTENLHI